MHLLSAFRSRRRARGRLALLMATFVAAVAIPTFTSTGVAHAAPVRGYAFLWANQPSNPDPYWPDFNFSANSTGGVNVVDRTSLGAYTVTLPGLGGGGGHVQVVAQGTTSSGQRCKVTGWGGGTEVTVNVICMTGQSTFVDSEFSLSYQHNTWGSYGYHAGYLWSGDANNPSVDPAYSFNSRAGANAITREGIGLYRVYFGSVDTGQGNVQVTAYGGGNNDYCKVRYWNTSGIYIACYDWAGRAVNTRFTVAYTANRSYTGSVTTQGAYGFASDAGNMDWYNLAGPWTWHSNGGAVYARKRNTGRYEVDVSSIPRLNDSLPLVTAYGNNSTTRCRIGTWWVSGAGIRASVVCQSAGGVYTDSSFSFAYLTSYT
jgi:hypothetical protein